VNFKISWSNHWKVLIGTGYSSMYWWNWLLIHIYKYLCLYYILKKQRFEPCAPSQTWKLLSTKCRLGLSTWFLDDSTWTRPTWFVEANRACFSPHRSIAQVWKLLHTTLPCNFFILTLLIFLTNRPSGKCFPYLDPGKGARLGGTLGELQDATMIGALHGHVDRGRHGGL
jgi:hypothetical protein